MGGHCAQGRHQRRPRLAAVLRAAERAELPEERHLYRQPHCHRRAHFRRSLQAHSSAANAGQPWGDPVGIARWREVPASALACGLGAPDQAAHHGAGGRGGLPNEVGEHRRLGRTTARLEDWRAALHPDAEKSARLRLPDAAGQLRRRELRPRLPPRRVPHRRLLGALDRRRTETRLREAPHVRGHHREPRLGRARSSSEGAGAWSDPIASPAPRTRLSQGRSSAG